MLKIPIRNLMRLKHLSETHRSSLFIPVLVFRKYCDAVLPKVENGLPIIHPIDERFCTDMEIIPTSVPEILSRNGFLMYVDPTRIMLPSCN